MTSEDKTPTEKSGLQQKLSSRHIIFMAMGGVIGTGIFKGSADTIQLAGPGVVLSYIFAGLLLLVVMGAIAEMATVYPNMNMKDFIRQAFGERVSFIIGWLYCFLWLSVCVIEVVAAGSFLQYWFTDVPLWILSLLCAAVLIGINFFSVGKLGEIEFWLAGIKIAMIIIFIILGGCLLFGVLPGSEAPGFSNYVEHGGLFPNGWQAVLSALLVVTFSFGGSELIGMTLTETANADRILPKVVKNFILRVVLFYTLPLLIICGLIPWNELSDSTSPFVQVLSSTGLKGSAHVMNFILVTAVISAANSGIYGATRMLHSMAVGGEAPRRLSHTNSRGVPVNSLIICAVVLLIGSMIAFVAQNGLFSILMAVPGFVVVLVWLCICLAQLKLRRQYPVQPSFRVWGFPYITGLTVLCLAVIAVGFMFDSSNRVSISVSVGFTLLLVVWSLIRFRHKRV
ncbi:amino acid permease [Paenibacillus sp. JX-17]|uniref:Amino acid permease n=1 Tax=Paenibacillus lacisoli TaxID=3064525 RepID=A0ABT9CHX1_9BACL|nr:amino acid permease [Paenibacillus sp. JX-17]MDO7908806.1 amino acid permease [Paenibacillus sp. JX-17]